jgi:death-on-curing protein
VTVWISRTLALAIHDEQLAQHGGALGIRDEGLLERALARPLNLAGYGKPDLVELASLYAIAIARNHPFVDGNKRTAFACMVTFIWLNGADFSPTEVDATVMLLRLAADDIMDDEFIAWVRAHTTIPAP